MRLALFMLFWRWHFAAWAVLHTDGFGARYPRWVGTCLCSTESVDESHSLWQTRIRADCQHLSKVESWLSSLRHSVVWAQLHCDVHDVAADVCTSCPSKKVACPECLSHMLGMGTDCGT